MKTVWKTLENVFDTPILVSNDGRVKTLEGKELNQYQIGGRPEATYLCVKGRVNGKWNNQYVHRLVAFAFLIKSETDKVINHIDGNTHNNSLYNLEWTDQSRNVSLRKKFTKSKPVSDRIAAEIRVLYNSGLFKTNQIAKMYNLNSYTTYRITRAANRNTKAVRELMENLTLEEPRLF